MTVSYQSDVASSTSGGLIRLLWRWRGSVWKLVLKELIMFQMSFLFLQIVYNYVLIDPYKDIFKWIVILCSGFVDMIPLSFILGFYVSFIATRWWEQYKAIPWPDRLMNNIAMYIPGNDETSRMLRRTLMRYANLSLILVLRSISIAVKRRFPTRDHLIEAGFMSKTELEIFSSVPSNEFNTFWIPCTWFVSLLREARQDCRITDSCGLKIIMEELNEFRNKCGLLWSYDWVSIPLVYTQVVTLATYCFFVASLFGRQHIDSPYPKVFTDGFQHKGERFVPVFSIIQFCLYMGLLKLGEQLINPFGDDDEDFELNWIIDRHIKVSLLGVDVLNLRPPPLTKDTYFGDTDIKLPYTAAAVTYKKKTYRGSMAAYHVPSEQQGLVLPEFDEDEDQEDYFFSNTLQSVASKGQTSLWSIFGQKNKPQSVSLLSLDSNRSENLSDWQVKEEDWQAKEEDWQVKEEDWQGSYDSYIIDNQNLNKDANYEANMYYDETDQYPKLHSHHFESIDNLPLEEVAEFTEPPPQVLKAKGILIKQSSQQSQESFPNQLSASKTVEERKISDTPSYSSSILKNRSTASGSSTKLSLFELQLGSTGKALSSVAGKSIETSSKKIVEKKRQERSIFKSGKDEGSRSDGRPSISSLKRNETKFKTSLFKKADPKLRIKPFKSKVTFSDEPSKSEKPDDSRSVQLKQQTHTTNYTIPEGKSTLTIHLDKYDLSASSPELNKASSSGKFPYSRHKLNIDKTESTNRLMNIRMATGSSASVVTASELFSKLPIETLLQLGLPSNQSSQSSEFKLGAYTGSDQRQRSSSFGKLSTSQALDEAVALRKTQAIAAAGHKLKNEIPETYLDKPKVTDANRRKSFQLQSSSQTPIEMHSEYDINFQDNFKNDSNDYWLRHRSLPNIQELVEDSGSENPSSPTSKDVNNEHVDASTSEYPSKKPTRLRLEVKTNLIKQPKDSKEQLRERLGKQEQTKEEQNRRDYLNRQSIGEQSSTKLNAQEKSAQEKIAQEKNAREKRTLYSKASKSSSSSTQSSSSLQRKCRKKIPIHLSSSKSNNLKQSSTDSDSSYYTAHSVHITIPEMETLGFFQPTSSDSISSNSNLPSSQQATPGSVSITMPQRESLRRNFHTSNESTSSSANLSYHSANELFKSSLSNLNDSTQSLSTETGTIPTIVVMPTSPVTSEPNVDQIFFGQTDEELQQDRRRRLLEHFHLTKEQSKRLEEEKDQKK